MPEPHPAIEISNLSVGFGEKGLFRNLRLKVAEGERVVITGASGTGKSTLLRCILGFTVPESGEVLVKGTPVTGETVWRLRTQMAYVPQEPELGEGTLSQWFEQPFSFKANTHLKGNLKRLPELLQSLSLPTDLLDAYVGTLSGGEKQRVALIAALLLEREILLLDEPTSALDKENSLAVVSLLKSQKGITILSVSHDPHFLDLADRVIPLPSGG